MAENMTAAEKEAYRLRSATTEHEKAKIRGERLSTEAEKIGLTPRQRRTLYMKRLEERDKQKREEETRGERAETQAKISEQQKKLEASSLPEEEKALMRKEIESEARGDIGLLPSEPLSDIPLEPIPPGPLEQQRQRYIEERGARRPGVGGDPFGKYLKRSKELGTSWEEQQEKFGLRQGELLSEREEIERGAIKTQQEHVAQKQEDFADYQEKMTAQNKLAQERQARSQKQMTEQWDEIQQTRKDLKEWKPKKWEEQGLGRRAGVVIAGALMAMSAGIGGRDTSVGIKYITQRIEQFEGQQKAEYERMQAGQTDQINEYGMLRMRIGDEKTTDSEFRRMLLDQLNIKTKEVSLNQEGTEYAAIADKLSSDLAQQMLNIDQNTAQTIQESSLAAVDRELAIETSKRQYQLQQQKLQAAKAGRDPGGEIRVPGMSLSGGGMPTPKQAQDLSQKRVSVKSVLNGIDSIRKHVDDYGTEWLTSVSAGAFETQAFKEGKAMARDLQLKLKDLKNLGVLAGPDLMLLESLVDAEPNSLWTGDNLAKLDKLETSTIRDWRDEARQSFYIEDEIFSEAE